MLNFDEARFLTIQRGAVALAPGLQIAKQLCRGLTAIHEAGIIHRDIKPQNVMVLPNGTCVPKDLYDELRRQVEDALNWLPRSAPYAPRPASAAFCWRLRSP